MQGCKTYQQIEHRDVVYIIARRHIENNNSKNDFILAAKVFLLVWDDVFYRMDQMRKDLLHDQLSMAYDTTFGKMQGLSNIAIDTRIDQVTGTICELFKLCYPRDAISLAGASKLLHLLKPDLFVMWDNAIVKNYHELHRLNENNHFAYCKDLCYVEFLRNCNLIAKAISTQMDIDMLQKEHPSYAQFGFRKTLAKMIDECNYAHFTKLKSW
jgi:hypothetical protein